jgi:hypothetical protein
MSSGKYAIILTILMLATAVSVGYAQCPLDMHITTMPVQQLSPADIDFEHFGSGNLLFTINIGNTGGIDASATIDAALDVNLADGTNYFDAVTFTTKKFTVPATGKTLTNLDLGHSGAIGTQQFHFDDRAKGKLQDIALSTGHFPAGKYVFHLKLKDVNCGSQIVSTGDILFQLLNASRVELRSPQNGAVTNEFPFFEFFHETNKAVLTVAEKTEGQSLEDAISRTPPMLQVELGEQNSFLYSGGRPLVEGKTYVWGVVGKSVASGGTTVDVPSPIWTFTVSSPSESSQETPFFNQLLLAFPKYKGELEKLKKDGFMQAGNCTLNGATMSEIELMNLLNQLSDNDSVVITFE